MRILFSIYVLINARKATREVAESGKNKAMCKFHARVKSESKFEVVNFYRPCYEYSIDWTRIYIYIHPPFGKCVVVVVEISFLIFSHPHSLSLSICICHTFGKWQSVKCASGTHLSAEKLSIRLNSIRILMIGDCQSEARKENKIKWNRMEWKGNLFEYRADFTWESCRLKSGYMKSNAIEKRGYRLSCTSPIWRIQYTKIVYCVDQLLNVLRIRYTCRVSRCLCICL